MTPGCLLTQTILPCIRILTENISGDVKVRDVVACEPEVERPSRIDQDSRTPCPGLNFKLEVPSSRLTSPHISVLREVLVRYLTTSSPGYARLDEAIGIGMM